MHTGMLHLHSVLRWILLIVALWAIVKMASGRNGSRTFSASDKRPALFYLIVMDLQLLVGLFLYFTSETWGLKSIQTRGFASVMSDKVARFFAVEHIAGMLIATILVHVGYAATKAAVSDKKKFGKAFTMFLVAFIIILASIPWPFRELGRGWMPVS